MVTFPPLSVDDFLHELVALLRRAAPSELCRKIRFSVYLTPGHHMKYAASMRPSGHLPNREFDLVRGPTCVPDGRTSA
jgi:hypothetical protein